MNQPKNIPFPEEFKKWQSKYENKKVEGPGGPFWLTAPFPIDVNEFAVLAYWYPDFKGQSIRITVAELEQYYKVVE